MRVQSLKVKSTTKATLLAATIAGILTNDEADVIEMNAIGAGAVNQMTKATIIAQRFLDENESNISFSIKTKYGTTEIDGKEITTIVFAVEKDA